MSRLPLLLSLALAPCTVSCASNEYGFDSEIHGQTGLHVGMQLALQGVQLRQQVGRFRQVECPRTHEENVFRCEGVRE